MRKEVRGGSAKRVENWLGGAGESGPEGRPSNTGEAGVSGAGLFGAKPLAEAGWWSWEVTGGSSSKPSGNGAINGAAGVGGG